MHRQISFWFLLLCAGVFFLLSTASHASSQEPSLEEMLGQMLILGFRGSSLDDPQGNVHAVRELIRNGRLGGIILFDRDVLSGRERNIHSLAQVKKLIDELQTVAPRTLFIAVDQEGGHVQRFRTRHGFTETPQAAVLASGPYEQSFFAGKLQGQQLHFLGVNLNFAPVLDLATNSDNPAIGRLGRAFSPDPVLVTEHAGAYARGLAEHKVLYCFKHFPGQGSAGQDSHTALADISTSWSKQELEPYRNLLRTDMPGMVMIGHVLLKEYDPVFPATLSKRIVTDLLRGDLGWQGVVISDDLQMKAVADRYSLEEATYLALAAGVDVLLLGNNLDFDPELAEKLWAVLLRLVEQGKLSKERIAESYRRIIRLKNALPTSFFE